MESVVARAKAMRREPTDAEQRAWSILRGRGLGGWKFRRQQVIGNVVVDFYCAEHRVALEIDGGIHDAHDVRARDAERTRALEAYGVRVVRVRNEHVNHETLMRVLAEATSISQTSPPDPLSLKGEGGVGRREGDVLGVRLPVETSQTSPPSPLSLQGEGEVGRREGDVSGVRLPVVMSIAGSDPSGGAGVQADLKTFHQHGVYGCAVISLLTVQNTRGVQRVELVAPDLVGAQIDAVLNDLPVRAIKTGALGSAAIIERVAVSLRAVDAPLVIDPVGFSKNRRALTDADARATLLSTLLPRCSLITPNLDEAAWLTQRPVHDDASMRDAARWLVDAGAKAVLIKGGHRTDAPIDLLLCDGVFTELRAPRVETRHTHGVGCSLSAAITARLGLGQDLLTATQGAKAWITEAIATAPELGHGAGPIHHFAKSWP